MSDYLPVQHLHLIAKELTITAKQVSASLKLFNEGATIPFVARYRKEITGSLDEVQLTTIRNRAEQLQQLDKRRKAIVKSLSENQLLSTEIENNLAAATTFAELEDIYLPYKPKRRTRATVAKERGLEPLANDLMKQNSNFDPLIEAQKYISEANELLDVETVLQGARDIIAEHISENKATRTDMRELFLRRGILSSKVIKGKELTGSKYKDYFAWQEAINKIPSHRLLAILRADKEKILTFSIRPEEDIAFYRLENFFVNGNSQSSEQVKLALKDSYKRLLAPSMENEVRKSYKEKADIEAISVFADNLRQLLLTAPLGKQMVLAIDPSFRTGCKVVCLDNQGKLLQHTTIFPHSSKKQSKTAAETVEKLVDKYSIAVIAIGNGTASRETEKFIRDLPLAHKLQVVIVSESGASIYSASEVARAEFPDHDVTVRGAVSIGRRLMDPLAELVKIDPKSIGVGQYQHDVDQNLLKKSLDDTVMSCVNAVGVDVNTASKELLTYVSGLGPALAQNVITYRQEHGLFEDRLDLNKVPRFGNKAFEQSAGFLRILKGKNPLDASSVHPERYAVVEQMALDLGESVKKLLSNKTLQQQVKLETYSDPTIGMPTLLDIMQELEKPGRDPRETFEPFSFAENVKELQDVQEGMTLPGIVTNITNFGVFIDLGVHHDGLIHISQLSNKYIKHPSEVVSVHQKVKVNVLSVDVDRQRIELSLKNSTSE